MEDRKDGFHCSYESGVPENTQHAQRIQRWNLADEVYFDVEWKLLCSGTRLVGTGNWPSGMRGTRTRISHLPISFADQRLSVYWLMHKMGDLAMGSPELLPYQQEQLDLPASIWKSLREKSQ